MTDWELRPGQVAAMGKVVDGADVFNPIIARTLRNVAKKYPRYISITAPMGEYSPREGRPYFGAILTAEGRKAIGVQS